ncbi:MAG TPA: fatty acid--CoA ligase family protein, partial [Acidimicrobiia bacterium]|nr:fatty acid--CoA ligase family protein [Acidimicrobiia bacterium]
AAFMPVNARLGVDEAGEVLEYARPTVTIVDEAHADPPFASVAQAALFADASTQPTGGVVDRSLDEADTHVVFFTSGSTGRSKGVVLSHRASYLRSFPNLITDWSGATVCMFPLFHMSGWSMALNAWQMRLPVHLAAPEATVLLETTERRRATRLYCLPAVWSRVLEADRSPFDLSSLRECDTGTSATPPELLGAIKEAFPGTVTRIYYGSTEAGPASLLGDADIARKPGSVGLPAPGVDLRLADDGEVCVRSSFLMDGYFEAPEATAEALKDGWYRTGDLGSVDDEGYLSIVGRARDVMRTGGETVAPSEVEQVLAAHPAVGEVAVVGLPDVRWGEVVCAVVVPAPGRADELSVDSLRSHCEGKLAAFKQPRRLELVDALPRTPATGQIQRTLLVARLAGAART